MNDTDIARNAGRALDLCVDVPGGEVKAAVHDHAITLLWSAALRSRALTRA